LQDGDDAQMTVIDSWVPVADQRTVDHLVGEMENVCYRMQADEIESLEARVKCVFLPPVIHLASGPSPPPPSPPPLQPLVPPDDVGSGFDELSSGSGEALVLTPPSLRPPATPSRLHIPIPMSLEIAGTVTDFDKVAFGVNLAAMLEGVVPSDVQTNASAGSVLVNSVIFAANVTVWNNTLRVLCNCPPQCLSLALRVTVLCASLACTSPVTCGTAPSLQLDAVASTQSVQSGQSAAAASAIIASVSALLGLCICLLFWRCARKGVKGRVSIRRSTSSRPSGKQLDLDDDYFEWQEEGGGGGGGAATDEAAGASRQMATGRGYCGQVVRDGSTEELQVKDDLAEVLSANPQVLSMIERARQSHSEQYDSDESDLDLDRTSFGKGVRPRVTPTTSTRHGMLARKGPATDDEQYDSDEGDLDLASTSFGMGIRPRVAPTSACHEMLARASRGCADDHDSDESDLDLNTTSFGMGVRPRVITARAHDGMLARAHEGCDEPHDSDESDLDLETTSFGMGIQPRVVPTNTEVLARASRGCAEDSDESDLDLNTTSFGMGVRPGIPPTARTRHGVLACAREGCEGPYDSDESDLDLDATSFGMGVRPAPTTRTRHGMLARVRQSCEEQYDSDESDLDLETTSFGMAVRPGVAYTARARRGMLACVRQGCDEQHDSDEDDLDLETTSFGKGVRPGESPTTKTRHILNRARMSSSKES
jgi:hypothetical protein